MEKTESTPSELVTLFGYFPRANRKGRELNRMWVSILRPHPSDVVSAVLHAHRLSRRGDDPCISTVSSMLTEARRQGLDRGRIERTKEKDHEVIAPLRAWAIFRYGDVAKEWGPREIVERRVAAEWNAIPTEMRPVYGTEYNTDQFRAMFSAAGVGTEDADSAIYATCGVRPLSKYDGMSIAEMGAAYRASVACGVVRDAKVERIDTIRDEKAARAGREAYASALAKSYRVVDVAWKSVGPS